MEIGSRPRARRTSRQETGAAGESLAADRLVEAGWRILARNLHVGRSEIDLLAVDPGPPAHLVIVEVRWRRQRAFGLPEETVGWRKRRQLRVALGRLVEHGRLPSGMDLPALPLRLDIVALEPSSMPGGPPEMRHYRAAIGS